MSSCTPVYLDPECPTNVCGPRIHCTQSMPTPPPRCPDACELEAIGRCAMAHPLLGPWFACDDPSAILMAGWELIQCLPWCNTCSDRSKLLIYAGAHVMALQKLMLAQMDAQVAGAMKGTIKGGLIDTPDHFNLTIPGKMLLQLRPRSMSLGGAGM